MYRNRILKQNLKYQDEFRGCLFGGAAGDALGYPVEFLSLSEILRKYGKEGIKEYSLSHDGKALISDDTQMTLFTATGLLTGTTRGMVKSSGGRPRHNAYIYPWHSYITWYEMQCGRRPEYPCSPLVDITEMGRSRAPGTTCMSVLASGKYGTTENPVNNSKGCGGIMRVAPVGLYFNRAAEIVDDIEYLWQQAAAVAALTHGHELGYLPAAVLAHIVNRLCYTNLTLSEAVSEATNLLRQYYGDLKHTADLISLMELANELTRNSAEDTENIAKLGEGWVAEETLAIALYAAIKYEDDFSKALTVSVNHSGDSDSTGSVTGNILGTLHGYSAIPDEWKQNLECSETILEVADDLCHDCLESEWEETYDRNWVRKYCENRWRA